MLRSRVKTLGPPHLYPSFFCPFGCAAPAHQVKALCAPKDAVCAQSLHNAATLNFIERLKTSLAH